MFGLRQYAGWTIVNEQVDYVNKAGEVVVLGILTLLLRGLVKSELGGEVLKDLGGIEKVLVGVYLVN